MRYLICVLLLVSWLLSGCQSAPQANPQVDKIFANYDSSYAPGCAVGVIQNGQWAYQHAYGMADLEAKTPITTQSTFYIGSGGKQFTAMSILLLVEQGKLSLDDDIHKYLPELPDYGACVTVGNLIHHTSGIKDYLILWLHKFNDQELNTYDHLDSIHEDNSLKLIASQKELDFSPGNQYAYSNSNYFLLGVIVKRVSGKSLRQFADENIFNPLGMNHTQSRDAVDIAIPGLAMGYMQNTDGTRQSTRKFPRTTTSLEMAVYIPHWMICSNGIKIFITTSWGKRIPISLTRRTRLSC